MKTRTRLEWRLVLVILIAAPTLGICTTQVQLRAQSSNDQVKAGRFRAAEALPRRDAPVDRHEQGVAAGQEDQADLARPVEPDEVGKEFQTADHVKEKARAGFWLCVGVAGEPWFQSLEKIEAKYEPSRRGDQDVRLRYETADLLEVQAQGDRPQLGGPGQGTRHCGILCPSGVRPGTAALFTGRGLRRQGRRGRSLSRQAEGRLAGATVIVREHLRDDRVIKVGVPHDRCAVNRRRCRWLVAAIFRGYEKSRLQR